MLYYICLLHVFYVMIVYCVCLVHLLYYICL